MSRKEKTPNFGIAQNSQSALLNNQRLRNWRKSKLQLELQQILNCWISLIGRKNQMTQLINITSVPAEKVETNQLQIVARWKSTDKNPVPECNKVRAVIIDGSTWNNEPSINKLSDPSEKTLRLFLLDAIEEVAVSYLRSIVEDSKHQRTQVNLDAFSLSNLLQWQAEQAAISGRLNGDTIKQWISQSATVASVTSAHGEKVGKALSDQFIKLAGPNHGLTPEKADKLLSSLWKVEDADTTTGLRVMLRLQAIRDKAKDEANVLDSIL